MVYLACLYCRVEQAISGTGREPFSSEDVYSESLIFVLSNELRVTVHKIM